MTAAEIRQSFLDFFESKGHAIVPSASLMPDSPNLLFTNAGMNQFVPYFLNERPAPWPRAADTQKCIRAGGKHNDLEDVGFDTYHHTFFEMLGNWSFGDYFKQEAIAWAWELLTGVWGFPKERLYATVYKPGDGDPAEVDQEAYDYWKALFEQEGLDPQKHILFGGKKDNFWMMGDTGPCGPCSELHIDLTEKGDTGGSLVNADSPWCIEIWNLVFIQFNANADGSYAPLPARHVDTGMGFERVAGILATTKNFTDFSQPPSNYNSDLFTDLFAHLEKMSGRPYRATMPENREQMNAQEMNDCVFRVLADHIRTLSFSIADGIYPGNEGRNYVLRRILRRAVMYGKRLELPSGFFTRMVDPLIEKMGPFFPELKQQQTAIRKYIQSEEQTFERTLDRGLQLLDKLTEQKQNISGEDAFTLYDTYGFPLDLTELIARERGLSVDLEGFENEMEKQRQRARAAQKKSVITVSESVSVGVSFTGFENVVVRPSVFTGYEAEHLTSFETEFVEQVEIDGQRYVVCKETPFYAEMGGQLGDHGTLEAVGQCIQIVDTIKDDAGRHLHRLAEDAPTLSLTSGDAVKLTVQADRRKSIQAHHSATHLLHWGLREVLGEHVRQAGSLVSPRHLRFDFSHFEAVTPDQLRDIEERVNRRILENAPVKWYEVPFDEKPEQAVAFFGEKYGDIVRIVDIGGYSVELCGGTHVSGTGECGLFKITQESAIAAGTRRIEAVCGQSAYELASQNFAKLNELSRKLSCKPLEVEKRLEHLLEQRADLEKKLREIQQAGAAKAAGNLAEGAVEKGGLKFIAAKVDAPNPNELRGMGMKALQSLGEGVVVLGGDFDGKATVVALCSPGAIDQGHKAGDIIRDLAGKLDGKGGGKPDFAMGGGKAPEKLEAVLKAFRESA